MANNSQTDDWQDVPHAQADDWQDVPHSASPFDKVVRNAAPGLASADQIIRSQGSPQSISAAMSDPGAQEQAKRSMGAAMGQAYATDSAPFLKRAGQKVAGWLGKSATGLTQAQAAAYIANPEIAKGAKAAFRTNDLGPLSDQAGQDMKDAAGALGDRASDLSDKLSNLLTGKTIPEPYAAKGVSPEADALLKGDLVTGQVPAEQVQKAKQILQEVANYAPSGMTPEQVVARQQAAGDAAGQLKSTLEDVGGPGVKDINQDLQTGINVSKTLAKKQKDPLAFLLSNKPSAVTARQMSDTLAGSNLAETANQMQAGKALAKPPGIPIISGLRSALLSPAGEKLLDVAATPQQSTVLDPWIKALLLNHGQQNPEQ